VALKKNFLNLQAELDGERAKNDNIGLELINLVHENKALQSSTDRGKAQEADKNLSLSKDL
jgi:hypothetical protein